MLGPGGPNDAVVEQLMQQIAALKSEIEFTHSHYQKLLEQVAGPGWSKDMGPMERSTEGEAEEGQGAADGGRGSFDGGRPGEAGLRRGVNAQGDGAGGSGRAGKGAISAADYMAVSGL